MVPYRRAPWTAVDWTRFVGATHEVTGKENPAHIGSWIDADLTTPGPYFAWSIIQDEKMIVPASASDVGGSSTTIVPPRFAAPLEFDD